jgi:glycosyltransferase involved in cell wall biosynthesis
MPVSKLKVLFVLPRLNLGGAERVIVNIANAMVERNINVSLYVFSLGGVLEKELDQRINFIHFSKKNLTILNQIRATYRLMRILKRAKPDVLFASIFLNNIQTSIAHWLSKDSSSLILREANAPSQEWPKSRFYHIAKIIGPWLYNRADRIVVSAKQQGDDVISYIGVPAKKITQIGNPTIGKSVSDLAQEALPQSTISSIRSPLFLAVGRLTEQKAFDVLLAAFAILRTKLAAGTLFILGEGEMRSELQALVEKLGMKDHVFMPGADLNPFRYMSKADVFVLSSRYEGLPNVLIQALFVGTRCVATDCISGPREILENGALGRLVNIDDPAALADAMLAALQDAKPKLSEEWLSRYDENTVFDKYEMLLREKLKR